MEGEADATRTAAPETRRGEAFKQLKVRISKDDSRNPRNSVDASNHSILGGHGGATGWFWRSSCSGTSPRAFSESPNFYNARQQTCPSSPVHVPVTMAYTPAPGYVMFPVMLSGAPDSPRGGLTPLMGSPVSTPTAMMFPQTPFAQHPSAGPFAPPPGPAGANMRPASISGAPQVSGGPQAPDGASAFFHPLFNGFNAFGAPAVGMAAAPPGAFGGPGASMVPLPPPSGKQPRNSNAGDKGRPYQPSPLKPGCPRKSSGNGGPPGGVGAFPPMMPLIGRTTANQASAAGVNGSSGPSMSPQQPSTASSGMRTAGRPASGQSYQTPAHSAYHHLHGASGVNGGGLGAAADGADASPSPHQPASLSPEPSLTSYSTSSAPRPPAGTSTTNTPRDALDPTTAAAAAAVVAAAAAAVSNMSSGPTPRTSYTGPSVTPPPRNSLTGNLAATASGRTSSSGAGLHGTAAAAAANALSAANVGAHVALQDESASLQSARLNAEGAGLTGSDVDLHPYGNFVAQGMAHHMGGHAAAAAAAASAASAWGFYDASAAVTAGIGSQPVWPAAAMPRLFGAAPHITHLPHPHSHHQVAAMAAAAQQHVQQPAAAIQQPSLLHAAMLQQLAAAANVPTGMPSAMPCYVAAPSLDNDYMAAAAAENLQAQMQGLQSLQGAIIASQNLRAVAAAVADMQQQQQQQHPGVMAQVAATAAGLPSGGMLMNPAFLSGALGAHHAVHHHLPGAMHMHGGMGMGGGLGPRQRRNHSNGVGGGAAASAAGPGTDGQVRLNARQRRTLRRAKERAIRGLLEAGKLLVARTMGEGGAEGDEGAASGCDIPSGGYDTDDGDQSDDGESPARPACDSACSASAVSGVVSSPEVSLTTGVSASASAAAAPSEPASAAKYPTPADAASPSSDPASAGQQRISCNHNGSPSSSNASSVCEAGSSGGRAVSNTSSVGGPETLMCAANSTPSSGKVSPLSAEGSNEPSPTPAPAAQPPRATASAAVEARASPSLSGRSTSAGGAIASAGSAAAAAAALAAGATSDLDIAALIQQLNQKREEGLVDEKLLRDLEIINNLIGALKSSVPNTTPSYNAQGRKPSSGHPHGHGNVHHHSHGNVNAGHALHYLNSVPKLPKGFAIGY